MKGSAHRTCKRRVLAMASVLSGVCLCVVTLLGVGGLPDVPQPASSPVTHSHTHSISTSHSDLHALPESHADAEKQSTMQRVPKRPFTGSCVVETCSDDWTATGGIENVNQDPAGCTVVRSMIKMHRLNRGNITGHWCKVLRAVRQCSRKEYATFIFRDDDTIFDLHAALRIARSTGAGMVASYKSDTRHVITNWFMIDTRNRHVCQRVQTWWQSAKWRHPEHDQYYFNRIFRCGQDGLHCVDKRSGEVEEVHCRSSLGGYREYRRQECIRYQIEPQPHLLAMNKTAFALSNARAISHSCVRLTATWKSKGTRPKRIMEYRTPTRASIKDASVSAAAMLGASALVVASGALRSRGLISGRTARKAVHTLCGVAYLSFWPMYSADGRLFAALVPITALVALLLLRGPLSRTVSRDSVTSVADALLGPTVYTVVLLCVTLVLWKQADAYIVIAQLCFGDAAAEVFGRRFGNGNSWPFAKHKSVAGSAAFAIAAAVGSVAMLAFYARFEAGFDFGYPGVFGAILIISAACAAAELIPANIIGDDNAAIAATAAILSHLLLQ